MPECYLYHPNEIPICITPVNIKPTEEQSLCRGGLRCNSEFFVAPDTQVSLEVSLNGLNIITKGLVLWCQRLGKSFLLSIGFTDPRTLFQVRMIEQACEVECYLRRQRRYGRKLNAEQAAREWIELHAADFPNLSRLQ